MKKEVLGFSRVDEAKTLIHQSLDRSFCHCEPFYIGVELLGSCFKVPLSLWERAGVRVMKELLAELFVLRRQWMRKQPINGPHDHHPDDCQHTTEYPCCEARAQNHRIRRCRRFPPRLKT